MYFKKIEMVGFKSFADRTTIEFNGGFTAIVGPNGCGKSNVSDAIRWVLGEQSAKSLRGDNMQDVIFKGTEKRRSLSYCEVSLTFDNADRFFNIEYDELTITRKLYRSGESEYLINKNTCRLKDIVDILFDSGIGKNGYSVIGQGKVSQIVDQKPEERRGMFEEASGIAKFKSRKDEAERKLERTRDNLTRLDDIRAEIDRQMGPLRRQAENAKKYLEYKGQLKDLEVNAYIYQYENANKFKDEINLKLQAISEELAQRQEDLDKATEEYNQNMNELSNFDKLIAELNEKILTLTVDIEKQEGETKIARERINNAHKENDRINLDITNANIALELCTKQKEEKIEALKETQKKLDSLNKIYQELSDKHLKLIDELALSENEAGESQQKVIDTLGSLSDVKSNVSRLDAQRNLLKSNLENIENELNVNNTKIIEIQTLIDENSKKIVEFDEKLKKIKENIQNISGKSFLAEKRLREIENNRANTTTQIKVYENRKKLLTEMQTEYEGYANSVKKLLKECEKNLEFKEKIVGVLASLIKVPEKFETAIEIALGSAVQNIVTFDEEGAKELISYLKQNNFGRATFLPIKSMKRRSFDERLIQGKTGVYGLASNLIQYNPRIESVISNLLGSTVIVENLKIAVDLARQNSFSFRIVTLEGDVVSTQGSLTGGSQKNNSVNLISRAREIETLGKEIERLNISLTELVKEEETLRANFDNEKQEQKSLEENKNLVEIELVKSQEKHQKLSEDLKNLNEDIDVMSQEKQTIINKLALIEEDLKQSNLIESALSGNKEDADQLIKQKQEKFNALRKERDEIVSNMTTVKVDIASCEANTKSLNDDIERLTNEISKQKNNISIFEEHLKSNNEFIDQAEEMIKIQIERAPSSKAKSELMRVKDERVKHENSKIEISNNIKRLDENKTIFMDKISQLNDKKYREETNLMKIDTELETMQERIYEEYNLVYAGCLELRRPDFDIDVAMPEINKLKKSISALGYVNVNAIEDCSTLLDRYNDLTTQSDDLRKAEGDLVAIIKDLSNEMVTKFNEEFDKINESFKIVFKELFGGGNARLELTENEDPLAAGVEIMVQLPGKAANKLSLLSGGEKTLTAIALLFSILRLKPLPFSLLDEIEAALDDANIERFASYLKKLSDSTQFIVITHRKPTMELADALYGVTMEEKGVSKIVSVKLSDAIKQAETEQN
ncbi:MAG: chromosome segregation protein SMC [Clostridia bacterium]|nr:chromosome segregation protein SMC [Clostridia bacterium]